MPNWPISFESPIVLGVASPTAAACIVIAIARRASVTRGSGILMLIGLLLLCTAAGGASWRSAREGEVAVMIDLSPSTRGASYRDGAILRTRIAELLGGRPYRLYQFAEKTDPAVLQQRAGDLPATRTIYAPPTADAVLLFSDGQFELPAHAPPTYPVIDPNLLRATDARVENVELADDKLIASVRNSGPPRELRFGGANPSTQPVDGDRALLRGTADANVAEMIAWLTGRDRWQENDQLIIRPIPLQQLARWWISRDPPPNNGWRHITPENAPYEPAEYLAAGVVVLADVGAGELAAPQRQSLDVYARQLGGGVLMLGGEHAFASGGYAGTALEHISPLASNPPTPTTHWIILVDSSGSMASRLGDNSRWRFATTAVTDLIPSLPPSDPLTLGNFAADVRIWQRGELVSNTKPNALVPNDVRPQGPTNLGPALREIARIVDPAVPSQLILITDAEAKFGDADELIAKITQANIHVHAITTQPLPSQHPLRTVIERTQGRFVAQEDPRRWAMELGQLVRGMSKAWLNREPVTCEFTSAGPDLPSHSVALWNQTWLKPMATALAEAATGERPPMVAAWNLGAGAVIACAYLPPPGVIEALATRAALPPRDSRFSVTWDVRRQVRVTIDAQQNQRHVNDLPLKLNLFAAGMVRTTLAIPQTAPGRYELSLPAPAQPRLAVVELDDHVIDRRAISGRYPAEFDAIGCNVDALQELAKRTGGEVIEPTRTTPIEFPRVASRVSIAPLLCALGAAFLAAGLIRWRLA